MSRSFTHSLQVGDEILEVNGHALYGRCHLNASAVIKNMDGPTYKILLLRRESALKEMAVKPLTQFPVHLEEEGLEEKYNRFTGVRTVTVRKSPLGLGIMIIEGKHTDLGHGVFISDIQSGSPAEQSGLSVGDMILCVNQTDLICSDYDTVASLLKNAEGLLSIVVAKPNKSCCKESLTSGLESGASSSKISSAINNYAFHNNNNDVTERATGTTRASDPIIAHASSTYNQKSEFSSVKQTKKSGSRLRDQHSLAFVDWFLGWRREEDQVVNFNLRFWCRKKGGMKVSDARVKDREAESSTCAREPCFAESCNSFHALRFSILPFPLFLLPKSSILLVTFF